MSIIRRTISADLQKHLPEQHLLLNQVEISPDLKQATLWVSSFGQKDINEVEVLEALEELRGEFNQSLRRAVATKFFPKLNFRFDSHKAHAARIDELLDSTD